MSKSSEMVLYRTCKRMIQRGTIDGLAEKIDILRCWQADRWALHGTDRPAGRKAEGAGLTDGLA